MEKTQDGTADCPFVLEDSSAEEDLDSPRFIAINNDESFQSSASELEKSPRDDTIDITAESDAEQSLQCADGLPVYEEPPKEYTAECVIRILMDPKIDKSKVCNSRPLEIEKSSTFVVNLSSLKDPDDVKSDNFGVWQHSGSHVLKFQCRINEDAVLEIGSGECDDGWSLFSLRRLHSKHPTNANFRRMIAVITNSDDIKHPYCLVTYHIPNGFRPPVSKPHGNSKSLKPYHATWPSTMKLIKDELKYSGPKDVVAAVSAKVGGVMGAGAPGQIPRGETQASMLKQKYKQERKGDELFTVMQHAKVGEKYVREVKASPDPAIVVASERQLNDLTRFCGTLSNYTENSILTIDPTFCLGDFECTPISYRHLLLESVRYRGSSPIFLGPVLIHYRKNFGTYLFFASSLVSLRRDLQSIRSFGTDGEQALIDAFSHEFRYAIHLYCSIHVRNNIKANLSTRKYPSNVANQILDEIFGKKVGGTYVEGLVDATSCDDFFDKLEAKKGDWMKREDDIPGVVQGFYQWFYENKAEIITSGMISSVRESAGLGCPPIQFTTNACESINAMLKRKVNYKKNELSIFLDHLKELIDEQDREVERELSSAGVNLAFEKNSSI